MKKKLKSNKSQRTGPLITSHGKGGYNLLHHCRSISQLIYVEMFRDDIYSTLLLSYFLHEYLVLLVLHALDAAYVIAACWCDYLIALSNGHHVLA